MNAYFEDEHKKQITDFQSVFNLINDFEKQHNPENSSADSHSRILPASTVIKNHIVHTENTKPKLRLTKIQIEQKVNNVPQTCFKATDLINNGESTRTRFIEKVFIQHIDIHISIST